MTKAFPTSTLNSEPDRHDEVVQAVSACPLLALLRPAAGPRGWLLIGVDRKSSTHPQNDVIDPKRTWRALLLDRLVGAGQQGRRYLNK